MCNYRPISVTPTFAKLFEKLLLFQMMDHINKNNLLNKEPFGFRNKKSSTDALLYFTDTVIEDHENGQNTDSIFLDLAKAFNSISHKIFKKAECFNFSEPAVNLLRSFLKESSQCVEIGTEVSEHIFVNHGVPQGTVFFFYTLTTFQKKSKVILSLFDLQMILVFYVDMSQKKQLQQKLKKNLLKTDSYLKENQLTLNADKTEPLYFSTRDELEPKVTFKGKSTESCRYLGLHLDAKLTFEAHLNVVLKKMAAAEFIYKHCQQKIYSVYINRLIGA